MTDSRCDEHLYIIDKLALLLSKKMILYGVAQHGKNNCMHAVEIFF